MTAREAWQQAELHREMASHYRFRALVAEALERSEAEAHGDGPSLHNTRWGGSFPPASYRWLTSDDAGETTNDTHPRPLGARRD